jgi:hypothetical protein
LGLQRSPEFPGLAPDTVSWYLIRCKAWLDPELNLANGASDMGSPCLHQVAHALDAEAAAVLLVRRAASR